MPRFVRSLFGQVVTALVLGVVLGVVTPNFALSLKPLGDGFIRLITMIIGPIVFCVVVHGIAGAGDLKRVGRVGLKAVLYFEALTTLALLIGIVLAYTMKPGVGMNIDPRSLDASQMATYAEPRGRAQGRRRRLLHAPDPDHRARPLRQGRRAAGADLRHPVRLRALDAGRARQAAGRADRPGRRTCCSR